MIIFSLRSLTQLTAAGLLALLLMSAGPAYGHKVTIFAWVESGTVHTESKFSGGRRVKGGKIEAFDHRGRSIHTGITNDEGYYDFAIPAGVKQLKIVLTAGMGHTNHWTIQADELGAAEPHDNATASQGQTTAASTPSPVVPDRSSNGLDARTIETIVEQALERKLAPIRSQLADQRWGLRDILAGLGYILGLMGLASYMHFRKQTQKSKDP
jgi:nickel transport protein